MSYNRRSMGQFALGIRSLLIRLAVFFVMAVLLAWALGGTLWPRAEVIDLDAMYFADPDADGVDNFSEYALGGIPKYDDADTVLPSSEVDADTYEYVFNRRLDAAERGLSYILDVSTNLLDAWIPADPAWETGSANISPYFESVTNQVPVTGLPEGFIRLKIEE